MAVQVENKKYNIQEVKSMVFKSLKRTHDYFLNVYYNQVCFDEESVKAAKMSKLMSQYRSFVKDKTSTTTTHAQLPSSSTLSNSKVLAIMEPGKADALTNASGQVYPVISASPSASSEATAFPRVVSKEAVDKLVEKVLQQTQEKSTSADPLLIQDIRGIAERALVTASSVKAQSGESLVPFSQGLIPRKAPLTPKPQWHAPWKLMRVISGHTGWVRCVDVDPANMWFATGSADRMIKIWDMASGTLKLSLTGHISTVRGVVVSPRHPYLFSCGEDKTIKCWDLEQNKVIRHYHGHLSAVYCLALHPTIDVILTGSRDATCRVWDIRTKACIFTMTGHTNTVASVCAQGSNPQVITGSHDCTIRTWDLAAGRSITTLTNHKKSVRSLALHPKLNCMASASAESIKQWKFPEGTLLQTLKGHKAIINSLVINEDDVVVSGGDNGSVHFWDWKTGYNFDSIQAIVQPGSLDSEAGIFALTFDKSSSRLISCEADKSIKIYKENDAATEETHPIKYKPELIRCRRF